MSEWSKEHAWKVCVLQKGTKGSNPFLSAFIGKTEVLEGFATHKRAFKVNSIIV